MSDASPARSSGNPFWDFSLVIYASKEVQTACLALQDGDGIDVNVMLFALYLASTGRSIGADDARRVVAAIEPWKTGVVVPLRTARRNLKAPPRGFDPLGAEALRTIVKQAELEAERLQQTALHQMALAPAGIGRPAAPREAARGNLEAYGSALGRQLAKAPVGVMLTAFDALMPAADTPGR
jgi:uncharacterized protein (TIGR02444 family)